MSTVSTNFTPEQKSQLAKLMTTENLTVQHQKIPTAKFDVKNRILYLPIWQDMSSFLYDHLAGHEVGHALYTPAEGWHDAVVDKSKGRGYKSFLNIVEDARIEKKVKRKFPGLRQSFVKSFGELMRRDFFGIAGRDMNRLPFIDRANLYSKSQYTIDLEFSDRENEFIDRLQNTETWEGVVRLTDEIYEYAKNEEPELESGQDFAPSSFGDNEEDAEFDYEPSDDEESDEAEESENGDSDVNPSDAEDSEDSDDEDEESESESKSGEKNSNEDDEESDEESEFNDINREKLSQESDSNFDPISETDENYRRNEVSLLDESSLDYIYLTLPKPNLDQIVTPAKRVQELLSEFYEVYRTEDEMRNEVNEFKRKNERYVSLLAKEFEMKKAAKAYAKRKVSDTGDIDINKLSGYQFNDNIFRKLTTVSKGKSHGLVLLLDYSGSMGENMSGSIEQILVLTMFCRKVNIPFVVYTFGNHSQSRSIDFPKTQNGHCFNHEANNLLLNPVRLREWINSRMSNAEYSKAMRNLIMLRKSFENSRYKFLGRPASETLSNTPTLEAVVALQPIVKEFTRVNNLDLTNLVIVQDGDADILDNYIDFDKQLDRRVTRRIWSKSANFLLQDKSAKFTYKIDGSKNYTNSTRSMSEAIFTWFSKTTGSKIFGFYVIPGGMSNITCAVQYQYFDDRGRDVYGIVGPQNNANAKVWELSREIAKKLRTEKFLLSNKPAYNGFYMIPGGKNLVTEDDELTVDGKFTANKLKTAFLKMNVKRQLNRVLVSKFIDGIAA